MINLLPPAARTRAAHEYQRRLAALCAILAAALATIGAGLLFPAYTAVQGRTSVAREAANLAETTLIDPKLAAAVSEMQIAAALLSSVEERAGSARPSAIIELLAATRPPGIIIRGINYSVSGATINVTLGGVAATRDSLLAFKSALGETPGVASADFPPGVLAASSTILFSMRVKYTPPTHTRDAAREGSVHSSS